MPLPSTRLYWRMALYIGAALVAFVLLSMASVWFVARGELENYTATKHSGLGREAARVLAAGGREALLRWLDHEAVIPDDVTVYVLDAQSHDLRGQAAFLAGVEQGLQIGAVARNEHNQAGQERRLRHRFTSSSQDYRSKGSHPACDRRRWPDRAVRR